MNEKRKRIVGSGQWTAGKKCIVVGGRRFVMQEEAGGHTMNYACASLPTPHRPPSTNHCPFPRSGISLLEVLAAIGVLSIGILGLAALLPIGRMTLLEATKADRAGDCGRAGMRDIVVRRMLDPNGWTVPLGSSQSIVIDPHGLLSGANGKFGNGATIVPRTNLKYPPDSTGVPLDINRAQQAYVWPDDLVVSMPEEESPAKPYGRSSLPFLGGTNQGNRGDYSWFASVVPTDATHFSVSVVVCHKRDMKAERAVKVSQFFDGGLGGGSMELVRDINDIPQDKVDGTEFGIHVKENDWVALCSKGGLCRWYRVASTADNPDPNNPKTPGLLTLVGPDWDPSPGNDQLVALGKSVIGVYTTTIELDTDSTWKN